MTTENTENTSPEAPEEAPPAQEPQPAAEPAPGPAVQPSPAVGGERTDRPSGPGRPPGGRPGGAPYRDSRGGGRGGRGGRRGRGRFFARRRVCSFCVDHVTHIDYKDVSPLRRYVSDIFKIEGRRKTGTCAKHQRALATAIKRARHLALIPFSRVGALDSRFPG